MTTLANIPIIILSVAADEDDKARLLQAGADDYVVKPFGMAELLARSEAALRRYFKSATENPVVASLFPRLFPSADLPDGSTGSTLKRQLVAQVTANESQPLVEAVRIGARLVGRELDEIATPGSALAYRPFEHLLPDTGSPVCRGDSHRLDLSAPGALPCQSGNEGKLKGANHLVVRGRYYLQLVGISKDGLKRIDIFRVCR
ncbi:CheY-like chemotaxis protein [Bradyrhizobium sp. AZCC 2230]